LELARKEYQSRQSGQRIMTSSVQPKQRYSAWLGLVATAVLSQAAAEPIATVSLTNSLSISRQDELVTIPLSRLGLDQYNPSLRVLKGKSVVPIEPIDTDDDGRADALVMIVSSAPKQVHHMQVVVDASIPAPAVKKQTQAEVSIKEGGQWNGSDYVGGRFVNVPHVKPPAQYKAHSNFIRYEGPGIESDKVGYRIYLDERNGFDIFGKKIPDMVLQNIGKDGESYENDAPWGLDILKVGSSLGTGGFGYWNGKQVESIALTQSHEARIVTNGNLYSAFDIHYNGWQVQNHRYGVTANVSMHAGSRLAHVVVKIKPETASAISSMAVGVVKHPNTKLIQSNIDHSQEWSYAASWGKQSRIVPDEYLGMGVIFRRAKHQQQTEDESSYVSLMDARDGLLDYYFFAAWDKEPDGIKTEAEFKVFLDAEVTRLSNPLRVTVSKPNAK
jgi:unsaturated rhamnogalacturonyl hydrolase